MTSLNPDIESDQALKRNATEPPKQQLHTHHHIAIRTRDIETAISFYSLLGFSTETKFRAGPARAAWLTNSGTRIEIIEVPSHILQEEPGTRQRALDLIVNEQLLGLNHFALDVTEFTNNLPNSTVDEPSNTTYSQPIIIYSLKKYLDYINTQSLETFGKSLRVAVPPQQKIIGTNVYELAFLYDADGSIVELLYFVQSLDMETEESMKDGWTPWDGTGFCGMVK